MSESKFRYVKIDAETYELMERYANALGISKAGYVRDAIIKYAYALTKTDEKLFKEVQANAQKR